MFTLASPSVDGETFRASDWNLQTATCSGGATLSGVEYHHVSSVSVGATANLLVASRELSTVWSLAHDGSGVQWTLSSQLESDFMFANPRDAFYQPHDVIELPNGNLLVIDDGASRPGCYEDVTAECFSRASHESTTSPNASLSVCRRSFSSANEGTCRTWILHP